MPYEYARLFIAFEKDDAEAAALSRSGEALIADGWKIHTFQITDLGEFTLFERYVDEVPPEPMRCK